MLKAIICLLDMLYKKFMLTWTLGHLTSSDTLPPPLSKDEEEALMQRLILGDTSVRRTLIERNLRLVAYIARKFENTGVGMRTLCL